MSHKILLADDSVTVQKIVTLTFIDEGIDVVPVNTGDDAIKRLQSLRPALVMADVSIPGKNGYEICAFVKSHPELKHIPVILLVPAFEPFDEERAARVGANHHLTKPFQSIRTLISTVKNLIEPEAQAANPSDLEWPITNPTTTKGDLTNGTLRNTGDILEEALAQGNQAILSTNEPDTGDLEPSEPFTPRDTAKFPVAETGLASGATSLPWTAYTSLSEEDDILELDDVLPPITPPLIVQPTPAPVKVLTPSNTITQSVKVTAVEAITTIPPAVIDDIVNRVAAQVTAQLSQQLQQFATRLSQDIAAQLNNPRPNLAIPPASPKRETDSLLDL